MKFGASEFKVGAAAPDNSRDSAMVFCLRMGQLPCLQGRYSTCSRCDLFADRIKEGWVKFDKRGSKPSSHLKSFPESLPQQFCFISD